jgi:Methylamine utilisation protein MauE
MLLIAVLVVSGAAKLRVPDDTASVFTKLRLPAYLLRMRAPRLLPFGELILAAMLLFLPAGWYVVATSMALLLFAVYLVVVVRALGFGEPILCGCFGRLGLGWITRQTAMRNGVLLAVAAITWVDSWRGDAVIPRLADAGSEWWWLAAVLVAMLVTALVVREGRMPSMAPPPVNEYVAQPVPYLVVDSPTGPCSLWSLSDEAARLLVFWDPTAAATTALPERLPSWRRLLGPVQVHLVTQSEWAQAVAVVPHLSADLLGDPQGEVRQRLATWRVPSAVLIGTDRLLAGGPAEGVDEIEELVEAAAEELRAAALAENAEEIAHPQADEVRSSAFSRDSAVSPDSSGDDPQ